MKNLRIVALAVLFAAPLAVNAQSTSTSGAAAPPASANASTSSSTASRSGPLSTNQGAGMIGNPQSASNPAITPRPSPDFYKKNPYWRPNRDFGYIEANQVGG